MQASGLCFLTAEKSTEALMAQAREWCMEGWGLREEPTSEQLAAAMLMEAKTQDTCVKEGASDVSYPKYLRATALRLIADGMT